jgi:hypothetical protein
MTPQERAAKVGEAMFGADVAARETMGIEIVSVAPGRHIGGKHGFTDLCGPFLRRHLIPP